MKIAYILPFALTENAGAAQVLIQLMKARSLAGDTFEVITPEPLHFMGEKLIEIIFPFYVSVTMAFRGSFDVVESAPGASWLYFSLPHRRKFLRVTFSQCLNGPLHDLRMKRVALGQEQISRLYRYFRGSVLLWWEAISIQKSDLFLALNAEELKYAEAKYHIDPDRCVLVNNGIDSRFLDQDTSNYATGRKRTGVVQVGSYEERKGVKTTRDAMVPLMRARQEITLTFLGTRVEPKIIFEDYPIDLQNRIRVLPHFNNSDLPNLLRQQDVFILPSEYEPFGLAPLEAMACGLATIVSNAAGPSRYVNGGENGLIVNIGDDRALRTSIEACLDDDKLYRRIAEKGITTAKNYSWRKIAEERADIYRTFLETVKGGGGGR